MTKNEEDIAPRAGTPPMCSEVVMEALGELAKNGAMSKSVLVLNVADMLKMSREAVTCELNRYVPEIRNVSAYRVGLSAEHALPVTVRHRLPALTLTPAGNRRTGSLALVASGSNSKFVCRIEVLDEELGFWLCYRALNYAAWNRLAFLIPTAETTSDGWELPLVPARSLGTSDMAFPAALIWRFSCPEALGEAVVAAASALGAQQFSRVRFAAVPRASGDRLDGSESRTVERLVRRRGPGPRDRRHPVRGSCDHCGQPLSDPLSLFYGIGPTCRRYYPPRVLAAVAQALASPGLESSSRESRSAASVLADLLQDWMEAPPG